MEIVMTKKKQEGQYMTPEKIVSMILDTIGYTGEEILNKKIMEPSFGKGVFLKAITERIINVSEKIGLSKDNIAVILNDNIYGIEKDFEFYQYTINLLNNVLYKWQIPAIKWEHLTCGDTLLIYTKFTESMDFVVGNPPYVRIHNIPDEYRNVLQRFQFINGTTDLYIIFYEIGIKMLNREGKLGYISPNSFLKNTSQQKFRNYLIDNWYLSAVYDFKDSKIFADAGAYTCICLLEKGKKAENVLYKEYSGYEIIGENRIDHTYFCEQLYGKPWNLCLESDLEFLMKNQQKKLKLQNLADIQNGVSTNNDSVYIFRAYEDRESKIPYMGKHTDKRKIVYFTDKNGMVRDIESDILHRCVKASRYTGVMENRYILFPYEEIVNTTNKAGRNENYKPYAEAELQEKFPKAYAYLSDFRKELSKRNMDQKLPWYLFARSQGIQNSLQKKIVLKNIINVASPEVVPCILDEDVIVYSKIYLTAKKKSEEQLKEIYNIIASSDFTKYCILNGKNMSGGYVCVPAKAIRLFGIGN